MPSSDNIAPHEECYNDPKCSGKLRMSSSPLLYYRGKLSLDQGYQEMIRIVDECGKREVSEGKHRLKLAKKLNINPILAVVTYQECTPSGNKWKDVNLFKVSRGEE